MDVFKLRDDLIGAYREYATSFMRMRDERIRARVTEALDEGKLWPYPQLGLNPAFRSGGSIDSLVSDGLLHPDTAPIFRVGKSGRDGVGRTSGNAHAGDALADGEAGGVIDQESVG